MDDEPPRKKICIGIRSNTEAIDVIAREAMKGDVTSLKYLFAENIKIDPYIIYLSMAPDSHLYAADKHLEFLRYYHEFQMIEPCPDYMDYAAEFASEHGHVEVLKYLHDFLNAQFSSVCLKKAVSSKCLKTVKYLYEVVNLRFTDYTGFLCIFIGDRDIFNYVYDMVNIETDGRLARDCNLASLKENSSPDASSEQCVQSEEKLDDAFFKQGRQIMLYLPFIRFPGLWDVEF